MAQRRLSEHLRLIPAQARAHVEAEFAEIVVEAYDSIKFGSTITGAPGQPVDTANLRNSWLFEFGDPLHATISTLIEYAVAVEDGVGPHGPVKYGLSGVGGSHSVSLTLLGMPLIAETVHARRKAA